MTDVWFYHLENWPLEKALPVLLERSVARGWRAVVQATSPERVAALDLALWTYDEASFLPHGTLRDGDPELQPILIMEGTENLNRASIRFMVERADAVSALERNGDAYERVVLLFDGGSSDALEHARAQWSLLKRAGHAVTYWQQTEDLRWEKRG